ncbi:MAG: LysR family transcriptional regulator [Clostridia bacterium]|nr:LysR family transcriptional regulator [Clostridia bacterium]
MNSENLKTFVLLSKLKNFTQTAERLFIAQSTVTNRIAELEREIGKKLFLRDSKNLSLTPEGAIFLDYVQRILELEDACLKEVHVVRSDKLRIGLPNAVYESFWEEKIMTCLRKGGVSFEIVLGHASDMLQRLQDKLLDVVYSFQSFNKAGYVCEAYDRDELVLVTSPQTNEYPEGIRTEQFSDLKFLMCNFALQEIGSFVRELFPQHAAFELEIDNSTKLIPYLVAGLGYSFLPRKLVQKYVEEGKLQIVPLLDMENPEIEIYRIYHLNSGVEKRLESLGLN